MFLVGAVPGVGEGLAGLDVDPLGWPLGQGGEASAFGDEEFERFGVLVAAVLPLPARLTCRYKRSPQLSQCTTPSHGDAPFERSFVTERSSITSWMAAHCSSMLGKGASTRWRIDYLMTSQTIADKCVKAYVERAASHAERWSDHAPVTAVFDLG